MIRHNRVQRIRWSYGECTSGKLQASNVSSESGNTHLCDKKPKQFLKQAIQYNRFVRQMDEGLGEGCFRLRCHNDFQRNK